MDKEQRISLFKIIASSALTVIGYILKLYGANKYLYIAVFIIAALTAGYEILIEAIENLIHGHILDENFLMSIGAIGAFILGSYSEGTVILILFNLGEFAEDAATDKSRDSISSLLKLNAEYANIYENGKIIKTNPEKVEIGTEICILSGEKVPIDCIVLSGESELSGAALTGESMPIFAKSGDALLAGYINLNGNLICKTTKTFENSAVSKILSLTQNEQSEKSKTESFVTRFAKYYTPAVVIAALLLFIITSLITGDASVWAQRAIMLLVVSCPCALVVSVPLTFFGTIGGAAKSGILFKGGKYIEALSKIKAIAFDKTGTLTTGSFSVIKTIPENCDANTLIKMAAICEYRSSHPIAESIKKEFNPEEFAKYITDFKEVIGKGAICKFKDRIILAGNEKLMEEYSIPYKKANDCTTVVYIAFNKQYYGALIIGDTLKEDCEKNVKALKSFNLKTFMLSGDNFKTANEIAAKASIDKTYAELLPADKVAVLKEIIKENGATAYIGDGINDAPVLSCADVGFSMGRLGSDAAIEASDVVITNDDLSLISKAFKISRKAMLIAKENIAASLIIKFSILILSVFGISNIYMAVFADVGVLILAILNSLRTLNK